MTIIVRLFATVKDKAGIGELMLELPEAANVSDACDKLAARVPEISGPLLRCAFAVNRTYVKTTDVLHDGDELAVIPPVSGGIY